MFPISIFKAFQKIFILTYKYSGQIQSAYYKFFNIEVKYIHVESKIENNIIVGFNFIDKIFNEPQKCNIKQYKELIKICDDDKLNEIGDEKYRLSKTWYDNDEEKDTGFVNIIKENTITFFHRTKSKAEFNMWTCFKKDQFKLKGARFGTFVSCNLRATNEYIEKINLAYLINCFINPTLKNFFKEKNIKINEDEYALSELLQWIFRSRIRKHEPINLYIPSQRMRELLENWE